MRKKKKWEVMLIHILISANFVLNRQYGKQKRMTHMFPNVSNAVFKEIIMALIVQISWSLPKSTQMVNVSK